MVTEAEGLKLHLSRRNNTGYLRVYRCGDRYIATRQGSARKVSLGCYDSAVAAAVAYAKSLKQAAAEGERAEQVVDGLQLHLSHSATGYRGVEEVSKKGEGKRFRARCLYPPSMLGYYDTAKEAAVAFARHLQQLEGTDAVGRQHRVGKSRVDVGEHAQTSLRKQSAVPLEGFVAHVGSGRRARKEEDVEAEAEGEEEEEEEEEGEGRGGGW